MLNFYELMNIIKNEVGLASLAKLRDEFINDFTENLNAINHNASTRKAALKTYTNNATIYATEGKLTVLSNRTTALYTEEARPTGKEAKKLIETLLTTTRQKPIDFHAEEAEALARALQWKPGKKPGKNDNYTIEVDGHTYLYNLFYSVYACLAGKDAAIRFYTVETAPGVIALKIISKYGIGLVLPINAYKNNNYNVTFDNFREKCKELDEIQAQLYGKTA